METKQTTESIFILLPTILGTIGDSGGQNSMGTKGKTLDVIRRVPKSSHCPQGYHSFLSWPELEVQVLLHELIILVGK